MLNKLTLINYNTLIFNKLKFNELLKIIISRQTVNTT